jgi:hypothetical protein
VPATLLTRRVIDLTHAPWTWRITIEQTANAAADWLELAEEPSRPDRNQLRTLALRVSLAHPFMQRFAGSDPDQIEPLLRLAAALALSEVIAREGADPGAFGRIRENVNTLLRRALAAP